MELIITCNGEHINTHCSTLGHCNDRLSDKGVLDSLRLAQALKKEKIDFIFCSDIGFRRTTTDLVFETLENDRFQIIVDPRIREKWAEICTKLTRETFENTTGNNPEQVKLLSRLFIKSDTVEHSQTIEETWDQVRERCKLFLRELTKTYPSSSRILIVGNPIINSAIIATLLKKEGQEPTWAFILSELKKDCMYFAFKTQPEDFIVEELLPFQLSGKGEFLYVFFEKRLVNTMEVLLSLCQTLGLKRGDIGIAGLKDKAWITRQRLSISQKALNACGGSSTFFDSLKQKVGILATWRHHVPLAIGKNDGNHFTIRLRGREVLPPEAREQLEQHLQKSKKIWFPNAFWIQRFGKGNKNFKKAKKIFSEGYLQDQGYQVKFMLQAFGSMWFNELVMKRRKEWAFILDWDIMVNGRNAFWTAVASYSAGILQHFDYWVLKRVNQGAAILEPGVSTQSSDFDQDSRFPTGAVVGAEQLTCSQGSPARCYDERQRKVSGFDTFGNAISQTYHLYGFRRPLRAYPRSLSRKREAKDLLLDFSLPTGSYASVFLATLLETIDPKGCLSNGLLIPLIS